MTETKQQILDDIARVLDRRGFKVSVGSTEPKALFVEILEVISEQLRKPALAEFIARGGGEDWDETCDSRTSDSGGGDTVTIQGLRRVRDSVKRVLSRR